MQFIYTALNEDGSQVTGSLDAESQDDVFASLLARDLIPQDVRKAETGTNKKTTWFKGLLGTVKPQELILFTKQFRTMFKAGVPVTSLLHTLEAQTENPKLKAMVTDMGEGIRDGRGLHEVFANHPKIFSPLYTSMIRAGESSGALPDIMNRLTYLLEHEFKVKNDIKSALQYPMIVVFALGVAFFVLLTFVIPKFVTIFESAGIDLPLPTLMALNLYEFLAAYWHVCLLGAAAGTFGLIKYCKTYNGRVLRDLIFLRIPIIGPVLQKSAMSRFASIFAILQSSGVSVLESLDILSGTIGNAAIAREFDKVKDQLTQGRGISGPLGSAKFFTPMVVHMVAIGEESGNLDEMLQEISGHYDDEVSYAVSQMATNLGPILIAGLALVVGFFALAVFLPMWDLTQMVR